VIQYKINKFNNNKNKTLKSKSEFNNKEAIIKKTKNNTIEQKIILSSKHFWFPISLQITISAPLLLFPSSQFDLLQTQTHVYIEFPRKTTTAKANSNLRTELPFQIQHSKVKI